ncbi:MAG: hypothetical protein IPG00_09950 [Saprospiraceae bacterium]|nr:hypothetical protein [Saprospiraceae bacterium]
MKQFLLLLTLVVFSFSSYGQVLYEHLAQNDKEIYDLDNDQKSKSQVADYAESWELEMVLPLIILV